MRAVLPHLQPTPQQLARYTGLSVEEFLEPPEVVEVVFAVNERGRRTPFNSRSMPLQNVGAFLEDSEHRRFQHITAVLKNGRRVRASLSVLDNLFDLIVEGWVVYSYRAEEASCAESSMLMASL